MTEIELTDGAGRAIISADGAELRQWQVGPVPLLWTADPAIWAKTAPILFPTVGRLRHGGLVMKGSFHRLPLHGFARHLRYSVIARTADRVVLRRVADASTRACYPYDWQLDVSYAVAGGALTVDLAIANTGAEPMPYACGLHPGFRWPFGDGARADCAIVFGDDERAAVPVITADGLFTRELRPVPLQGRVLPLTDALMAREALCFLHANSARLRFTCGRSSIACAFRDFPHLAVWSRAPGAFLCIEPWTGHGDLVDASPAVEAKPSMRLLAPGQLARHGATFSFTSDGATDPDA